MAPVSVELAQHSDWPVAFALLSNDETPDFAEQVAALGDAQVLLARQADVVAGALLFLTQDDGTLFVWPPAIAKGCDTDQVSDALLAFLNQRVDRQSPPPQMGQVILEPEQQSLQKSFVRNGFPHFVDLDYLEYSFTDATPAFPQAALTPIIFDEKANKSRFVTALAHSYIETLDCPEMSDRRTPEEALASHQQTGEFSPNRWWVFSDGERDVGILLMNLHSDQNVWEVVYVGVDPQARGLKYGESILRFGLQAARTAGMSGVMLAVDTRNTIARKIYAKLGFESIAQRVVHLRFYE